MTQIAWLAVAFVAIIAGTVGFSAIGLWYLGPEDEQ